VKTPMCVPSQAIYKAENESTIALDREGDLDQGSSIARPVMFAPEKASLSPRMLLPRVKRTNLPFPFNNPGTEYYYFGRNAIYDLALMWNLAEQEVLFPTYCEGIELEALLSAGVRLRFYPVHGRMRIDPEEVTSLVGPNTRAVYLIHYLGFPGPVKEIAEVCRARNVLLIEDCALALLSQLEDKPIGSFGDAAIFSVHKTLPTPNGGALVLRSNEFSQSQRTTRPPLSSTLAYLSSSIRVHLGLRNNAWTQFVSKMIRSLGTVGAHTLGTEPVPLGAYHFDRSKANLGMSQLSHLIISSQQFSSIVTKRRRNYLQLLERLRSISPPTFDQLPNGVCPFFYPLEVENNQAVLQKLQARGVGAFSFWSQDHPMLPRGQYPEVDKLRRTIIYLPCHQDLSPPVIARLADEVCEAVRDSTYCV
jgi:perosamine synthetase